MVEEEKKVKDIKEERIENINKFTKMRDIYICQIENEVCSDKIKSSIQYAIKT